MRFGIGQPIIMYYYNINYNILILIFISKCKRMWFPYSILSSSNFHSQTSSKRKPRAGVVILTEHWHLNSDRWRWVFIKLKTVKMLDQVASSYLSAIAACLRNSRAKNQLFQRPKRWAVSINYSVSP
jgi:hypothetical protein